RIEDDGAPTRSASGASSASSSASSVLRPAAFVPARAEPAVRASAQEKPVGDFDLASRLSYFIWGSMPDDALFSLADKRALRNPGVLEAQVRRMLADPKANNLVENFGSQWLQLRNLSRTKPDPGKFPKVDDELLDAMRTETNMF